MTTITIPDWFLSYMLIVFAVYCTLDVALSIAKWRSDSLRKDNEALKKYISAEELGNHRVEYTHLGGEFSDE